MRNTLLSSILVSATLLASAPVIAIDTASNGVASATLTQKSLQQFAQHLSVNYHIVTNRSDSKCDPKHTDGKCFQVELTLTSPLPQADNNWLIYFSQTSPIQSVDSDLFRIEHLNGDLHRLSPTDRFSGFEAGQSYTINYRAGFWQLSESDPMPNYYIVSGELSPEVITSTQSRIDSVTQLDVSPFVQTMEPIDNLIKRTPTDASKYASAQKLFADNLYSYRDTAVNTNGLILPSPTKQTIAANQQPLDLSLGIDLTLSGFSQADVKAATDYLELIGIKQTPNGVNVAINAAKSLAKEEYQLAVTADGVAIEANSKIGASYALYSIASAVNIQDLQLPLMSVEDSPRFAFRGLHIDVGRNFHSKELIHKVLDQMASLKLNKLHLHLADDEGWRIEIDGLPELTEVGGFRCHDELEQRCLSPQLGSGPNRDTPVNGFYSTEEYIDIVAAAEARNIQVIPSLDMPGHARAAVSAMLVRHKKYKALEQPDKAAEFLLSDQEDTTVYSSIQFYKDNTINVCMPSTYHFISKVIDEVKDMHAKAGQPLTRYHIGADETSGAWIESPICQALLKDESNGVSDIKQLNSYFIERVAKLLADKGVTAGAWNDGLEHTKKENMPPLVQSNAWGVLPWQGHNAAHEHANKGWQVVVSTPDVTYFDFPYEVDPKEHGYYWASRHINSRKVFSFMPENLPVHAEYFSDREEHPYQSEDKHPLKQGTKFVGLQAQLWSETIRTDVRVEYMLFPRLLALAERAWHQADWEVPYNYNGGTYSRDTQNFTQTKRQALQNDWQAFSANLGHKQLNKLDAANIHYRVPTPGAEVKGNMLSINSIFPGLPLEYRYIGQDWNRYDSPITLDHKKGDIEIRALSADGKRPSRITLIKIEMPSK